MKKVYDLKEVVNQELKQVKISREIEASIVGRCLGEEKSKKIKGDNSYRVLAKIVVWFIGTILTLSGTVYAMSHIEGLNNFIDETVLQTIAPHVQTINKGDGNEDVKLVVEAAVVDHYNALLVFSLINEGEEPWSEDIEVGYWSQSWTDSTRSGPPILSEDGRKLTYVIEPTRDQDLLEDKEFELKAGNVIKAVEIEEDINISLGELFEAHGTVLDTADYNYAYASKGLYMKLDRMLKRKIGRTQRQSLRKDPEVTLEYVGIIQDSKREDPLNPEGGLTIYTRNTSYNYWTGSDEDYVVGTISEVTDSRTGQVYKANVRAIENDVDTLWRGALGVSQFNELMDPSDIPYLKATKMVYRVQEVIVVDDWKVKVKVEDTTTIKPIKTNFSITEGSQVITIEQVDCSVLGVTIQGTENGKIDNDLSRSISHNIVIAVRMKGGEIIPLKIESGSTDKAHFIYSFSIENEHGDRGFLDTDQIEAIMINEEEVMVP